MEEEVSSITCFTMCVSLILILRRFFYLFIYALAQFMNTFENLKNHL